jgi:hypothetical protein
MFRVMGIGRTRRYEQKSCAKRSDLRMSAVIVRMRSMKQSTFMLDSLITPRIIAQKEGYHVRF